MSARDEIAKRYADHEKAEDLSQNNYRQGVADGLFLALLLVDAERAKAKGLKE